MSLNPSKKALYEAIDTLGLPVLIEQEGGPVGEAVAGIGSAAALPEPKRLNLAFLPIPLD